MQVLVSSHLEEFGIWVRARGLTAFPMQPQQFELETSVSASSHSGVRASLVPAAINAVINGAIAYRGFRGLEAVPLSVDAISSAEKTVWSEVVVLAFALSAILGLITAVQFQRAADIRPRRRLFPDLVTLVLEQAVLLFGACVVLAVLWQRIMGSVAVGPVLAAVLVAAAAALITVIVDVRVKHALRR